MKIWFRGIAASFVVALYQKNFHVSCIFHAIFPVYEVHDCAPEVNV